ncbi:hypothetical protein HanIR_Chr03g0143891 [Helianthus annuus]|nr:hypothetical protein HanIR_Chr03g0143891 [Helianthus annuus]
MLLLFTFHKQDQGWERFKKQFMATNQRGQESKQSISFPDLSSKSARFKYSRADKKEKKIKTTRKSQ